MTRTIAIAVACLVLGFAVGRTRTQPVSAAALHENADQVAAIAMWESTADLRGAGLTQEKLSMANSRIAGDICHARATIAPDVQELRDSVECGYRVMNWHGWWDRMVRGAKAQSDELNRDAAASLAKSLELSTRPRTAAKPPTKP